MPSILIVILIDLTILVAAIVHGTIGFGFSLLLLPVLLGLIKPFDNAIFIIFVYCFLIDLFILWKTNKDINFKKIWPLIIIGMVGFLLGTYILTVVDEKILKMLAGLVIIFFGSTLLNGDRSTENRLRKVNGSVSYFFASILKVNLSWSKHFNSFFFGKNGFSKQEFKANMAALYLAIDFLAVLLLLIKDSIQQKIIMITGLGLPLLLLGLLIGMKIANKMREGLFKNIATTLLIFAGLTMVIMALIDFL